ncbi:MAG: hypothetical protein D6750_05370 [Bacteroidetes bacterium]|nr:MAG: hypothetical protein D6750_05370 [Bacteroidota bacterium]
MTPPAFLSAQGALEQQSLTIRETQEQAYLDVEVLGDLPVLLPLHEVLVGGIQNRLPVYPLLLRRGRGKLPVFCVERDRWSGEPQGTFRFAAYAVPLPVRRHLLTAFMPKLTPVYRSRPSFVRGYLRAQQMGMDAGPFEPAYREEKQEEWVLGQPPTQEAIWAEVAQALRAQGVESPTKDVTAFYAPKAEWVEAGLDSLPRAEDQCGVAVFVNGQLRGIEWCADAQAWAAYHRPLLASYLLDVGEMELGGPSLDQLDTLLAQVEEAAYAASPIPLPRDLSALGTCRFFRFEGEKGVLAGYLLESEGQPYFLSAVAV